LRFKNSTQAPGQYSIGTGGQYSIGANSFAKNYNQTLDTTGFTTAKLHLVFTIPALLFSPIGEEIFFRGLLQRALEERLSARTSTVLECAAFGLVHLCHHGLFRTAAGISFLPVSGEIWAVTAFFIGLLFATIRKRSGSLFPAVASHMSFNLTMNVIIFTVLWRYVA
jgi:membrane protease YdiL (CAAX protease family)